MLNSSLHVSPRTRERVPAAIRRLRIRPNAQAHRVLKRHSERVCFVLSNRDFLHTFHARILQGVETYIPFVAFGYNVAGLDSLFQFDEVGFDGFHGAEGATRYLFEQGHRKIAFVGDLSLLWFRTRFMGYQSEMRSAKLGAIPIAARWTTSFCELGQKLTTRMLAGRPIPTAVMAGNDEIAYGLWRSLRKKRLSVPKDVSLVGFDDRDEAVLMEQRLATVLVNKE